MHDGLAWAIGVVMGLAWGFDWGYWKGLSRGYTRRSRGLNLFGKPLDRPVDNHHA